MQQSQSELDILTIENKIKHYLNSNSGPHAPHQPSDTTKTLEETSQHAMELSHNTKTNPQIQQQAADSHNTVNAEKKKHPAVTQEALTHLLKIKSDFKFLSQSYQMILNRDPDFEGIIYQINLLQSGITREVILYRMFNSQEFKKNNPDFILPEFIKVSVTQTSFKDKICQAYKKTANICSKLKQILDLPSESRKIMNTLDGYFSMINLQLDKITQNNEYKFQNLLANIRHTDNRLKDFNSNVNHQIENVHKQFDQLTTKIDHSADRSINVTHFHYEKCISQMDEMRIQLLQLQNQLQKLSQKLEV